MDRKRIWLLACGSFPENCLDRLYSLLSQKVDWNAARRESAWVATDFPYYGLKFPPFFFIDEYLFKPGAAFVRDGDEVHIFLQKGNPEHEERLIFMMSRLKDINSTDYIEYICL